MIYIKSVLKKHYNEIIAFGGIYGCIIVFALFGPVINQLDKENAEIYGLLSLVSFIIPFFIEIPFEKHKNKLTTIWIVSAFLSFSINLTESILFKCIVIFIYTFLIAILMKRWTFFIYKNIDIKYNSSIVAGGFFVAFSFLYIANVVVPSMNKFVAPIVVVVVSFMTIYFYRKLDFSFEIDRKNIPKSKTTIQFVIFMITIFICGGTGYMGIYPFLEKFSHIDRYYNVFPYVVALPIAGYIGDKLGKNYIFIVGTCCLGISFAFFMFEHNLIIYYLIQTFLQIGYGFLNCFGFSYSLHIARQEKNGRLFGIGIVCILVGALIGSSISYVFLLNKYPLYYYVVVTLIPIFVSTLIFSFTFEKSNDFGNEKKIDDNYGIDEKCKLDMGIFTAREKEIVSYMLIGLKNKEIAEKTFISENTLKFHARNIYSKAEVKNKKELIQQFGNKGF